MKMLHKKLCEAANDVRLSDAAFRRVVRDAFVHRQRWESVLISFERSYDAVIAQEGEGRGERAAECGRETASV